MSDKYIQTIFHHLTEGDVYGVPIGRKVVTDYAVEYRRQLKLRPNEKHRVRVKCKAGCCKWTLFAATDRDSGDFLVKKYHPVHKCIPLNKNKLCGSILIARKFKDQIVSQPDIRIWEIQELVRNKLGLYVGRTVCYRAKLRVLQENMGDWKLEFSRLCDYADMIKQTNPGSSCWIRTDRESEPGKNLFVYFYICFDALKKGWLEGCRNIIGFDGCFLKGACKGELFVAVGKNGNNQMYPIAWAVMDRETKHSWSWFLQYLIEDLQLGSGEGLTVMSDMQKGLIPAIMELLPNCEQRMCARHIWSNWHITWRGEERRKQFWRCAKSTFEVKFKKEMAKMGRLGLLIFCIHRVYLHNQVIHQQLDLHNQPQFLHNQKYHLQVSKTVSLIHQLLLDQVQFVMTLQL